MNHIIRCTTTGAYLSSEAELFDVIAITNRRTYAVQMGGEYASFACKVLTEKYPSFNWKSERA